jgi:GNAT superfamily N-acetyltransferase
MKHRINFDGQERIIDIRAMDEDFIVYRKMYKPPLTPDNIGKINPWDCREHLEEFQAKGWQKLIEDFFREHIRAIGSCAVLAWDGDGVIGKMYFTTKEMWAAFRQTGAFMCVEHECMPKAILAFTDEQLQTLLSSPSRTLRIACFNIGHADARYQGKGIAKAMLEFLKQWARERGWRKVEAWSVPDVVPEAALGGFILRRSAFERRGFHVAEETRASATQAAGRGDAIERILSGKLWPPDHWYMKSRQENIRKVRELAQDPSWKEVCDKDYVMAFDL